MGLSHLAPPFRTGFNLILKSGRNWAGSEPFQEDCGSFLCPTGNLIRAALLECGGGVGGVQRHLGSSGHSADGGLDQGDDRDDQSNNACCQNDPIDRYCTIFVLAKREPALCHSRAFQYYLTLGPPGRRRIITSQFVVPKWRKPDTIAAKQVGFGKIVVVDNAPAPNEKSRETGAALPVLVLTSAQDIRITRY
jgi:hypothetical protein